MITTPAQGVRIYINAVKKHERWSDCQNWHSPYFDLLAYWNQCIDDSNELGGMAKALRMSKEEQQEYFQEALAEHRREKRNKKKKAKSR